jgi:hypothetical protein
MVKSCGKCITGVGDASMICEIYHVHEEILTGLVKRNAWRDVIALHVDLPHSVNAGDVLSKAKRHRASHGVGEAAGEEVELLRQAAVCEQSREARRT